MRKDKPFRSVNVATILLRQIEDILKDEYCRHRTIANFVDDAVRRHLEYTEREIIKIRDRKDHEDIVDKP